MILRRLMTHVRDQNWFAVALDFFIVVLGVVIGFQITAWAGDRQDRTIESRHFEEIAEDLRADLAVYDDIYLSAVNRVAAVDYVYAEARGETLPATVVISTGVYTAPTTPEIPQDRLDNILGWINLVRISTGNTSGFDALVGSGDLARVSDRGLARAIQQYYASFDDLSNTQELFREFRNTGVRDSYRLGFSIFGETPVERVVAAAREDEAFASYIRTQREWAILHASILSAQRDRARDLLTSIERRLEETAT